jgi:hypothetical protein
MTSLTTEQYLALSEAVYADLTPIKDSDKPEDKVISKYFGSGKLLDPDGKPQLNALESLSDWRLIDFTFDTAFSAAALGATY